MKIRNLIKERKKILCLSFLLFIPVLLDFIKVLSGGNSGNLTYLIYIVSMLYIFYVFRKDVSVGGFLSLFLFYSLFGISYLLFPETQQYYSSDGFILLCLYFLPIVFLVVRKIDEWSDFFRIMSWFGVFAVLMGLYIVFFSGVDNYDADERYFTYMEFSYAQLPFVCSLYKFSREGKSWFLFSFFLTGFFEMLAFGSRATVLYVLLFIFFVDIANNISNFRNLVIGLIIIAAFYFGYEIIIDRLSNIASLGDSYFLSHVISGNLFVSESRDLIYDNCRSRIETMGLDVSGFFGDRRYCGSIYPHNIVYEVLMQWGWILGSFFLLYLLYLLLMSFRNKNTYAILIFLIFCLLGRYFVSGTYVTEGKFWIFYGCLLALANNKYNQYKNNFL